MTRNSLAAATVMAALVASLPSRAWAQPGRAASGRALAAPQELAFLDRFVGSWDVRSIGQDPSDPPHGRMDADYILDGTMLQADYRGLDAGGNVTFRGTSLRTWDPEAKLYAMKWVMSFDKGYTLIEARVEEGELVSTGRGEDDGGEFVERYRFFDFQPDAFKFEMERSSDGGANWKRFAHNQYTRRPS